ncbi:hypothetical protein [Sphingobacterium kyonggiense]
MEYSYKYTGLTRGEQGKRLLADLEGCKLELKDELSTLFNLFEQAIKKTNWLMGNIQPLAIRNGQEALTLQSCFAEQVFAEFGDNARNGKNGRLILKIKEYIILFKKLDSKGLPMNIKTANTKRINNQVIQLSLFPTSEMNDAPILYFGYQKNRLGEYVDPRIVYIDEEKVQFTINANQSGYAPDLFSCNNQENGFREDEKASVSLKRKVKNREVGN